MDTQGIFCFAHRQTEGAAHFTFHFCASVTVSQRLSLISRLSICYLTTKVFLLLPILLTLPTLLVQNKNKGCVRVTGRTLSDQVGSFFLVPKSELHAS